jgi:hypothetical protein
VRIFAQTSCGETLFMSFFTLRRSLLCSRTTERV